MIYELANDLAKDTFCTIFNGDFKIIFASDSHDELLGYPPNELLKIDVKDLVHPDDFPLVQKKRIEMIISKQPVELECRIKDPNGRWIHICTKRKPFYLDEKLKYVLVTGTVKENIMKLTS